MTVARLALRIMPGARETGWAGRTPDGRRRVRIAAPAIEGRANETLVAFVAKSLRLPRSAVRVERGQAARDKILAVDLAAAELEQRLLALDGDTE